MIKEFKIEGKILKYQTTNLYSNKFVVKSMPQDYKVEFKNKVSDLETYYKEKFTNPNSRFVIWDKNILNLYGDDLSLLKNNQFILNAIESNKNSQSVFKIIDFLQGINFTKKETIISVGGGITQDVTAFTRSIFKRGLNWSFVPTTLLSMADSCIGAKTALNHKGVKNQLALFSAPKEVLICTDFLKTLSVKDIQSGYGEIIKLVIIGGEYAINEFIKITNSKEPELKKITKLIKLSLQIKKVIIEKDEFEFDLRRSLNYGHTIGHAIEPVLNYKIPHGIAVSIGMIIENNLAVKFGLLDPKICQKYNQLIAKYISVDFLNMLKGVNYKEVYLNILQDKKTLNKIVNFAIPIANNSFGILKIDKKELTPNKLKIIFKEAIKIHRQ
jgi:3-dehydroquinate synthase